MANPSSISPDITSTRIRHVALDASRCNSSINVAQKMALRFAKQAKTEAHFEDMHTLHKMLQQVETEMMAVTERLEELSFDLSRPQAA